MANNIDMQIWSDDNEIMNVSVETGVFVPGDVVYGDTLTGTGGASDPVNVAPEIIEQIDNNTADIATNTQNIAENASAIANETTARQTADTALGARIDGVSAAIAAEEAARIADDETLQAGIDTVAADLATETSERNTADNDLQSQIDALSAASDVTDIVGTHADLESYDTAALGDNDIIKVLQDVTQNDATTYYRWNKTTQTFTLIGDEGPYYTRAQTDELLDEKQDTLTAGDGIVIENNVISAQTTGDFVPQYATMPTADATNAGEIVQYVGQTIPDGFENGYFYKCQRAYTDPSATISQTVGSGLTDLSVNVDRFVAAEQPTGDTTVDFVATITQRAYAMNSKGINNPTEVINGDFDPATFRQQYDALLLDTGILSSYRSVFFVCTNPAENYWVISPNQNAANVLIDGVVLMDWGLNGDIVATEENAWIRMNWARDSILWTKNDTTVDLAEYGISYSGTPGSGDTLTVEYTAPVAADYAWTQINVQPASKSGVIEWKTTVDLPGDYSGDLYSAAPYYTIAGGLPDGTYEFYFATKTKIEQELPVGEVIFKVKLTIDNTNNTANGIMGYVFNGDYMPDSNSVFQSFRWWNFVYRNNTDLILWHAERPWGSAILAYNNHVAVPECFKLSAIKNVDTGDEYTAVGAINIDNSMSTFDVQYNGIIDLHEIVPTPNIPVYRTNQNHVYNDDNRYFRVLPTWGIANNERTAECTELDVSLVSSNGGRWHCNIKNGRDSHVARLLEATGDLANAQIGYNDYGETFLFINTPAGAVGDLMVSIGATGASQGASIWPETPNAFTPITITAIGGAVTAENIGTILQYDGATDANYTNGYFYKATGDSIVIPESTVCTQIMGGETIDITCLDFNGFAQAFAANAAWTVDDVKARFARGAFMAYRPSEPNQWYFSDYGEIPQDWGIGQYFTLSPNPSAEIQFTITHTPEHTEIQNGRWERVNVQPGAAYTAGTGISIDANNEISVADPVLMNKAPAGSVSFAISNLTTNVASTFNVVLGYNAYSNMMYSTAIGNGAFCSYYGGLYGTAIGADAGVRASYAIQIGNGTNADRNTFKVGNSNGNFEIMSADGTAPVERFTTVPAVAGTYSATITVDSSGNITRAWAAIATAVDSTSTNAETVGAKLFYDTVGDIETLINAL